MDAVYSFAIAISAALSIMAILSNQFHDNTAQRIGLSVIGFASCIALWSEFFGDDCCQIQNSRHIFVIGFALYAIGTLMKVRRHRIKK